MKETKNYISTPEFSTRDSVAKRPVLLIAAGGTGGHILPALAVAEQLRDRFDIHWLGSVQGLEKTLVPPTGIPLHLIAVSRWRGRKIIDKVIGPIKTVGALFQTFRVFRKLKPALVLGMGGYASGPGGMMAYWCRVPLILHEQNTVPAFTNRLLAPLAKKILTAFPNTFSPRYAHKTRCIGNPLRASLLKPLGMQANLNAIEARQSRRGLKHLLIFGGSQGAQILNEVVPKALALLPIAQRPRVWHQTRQEDCEAVQRQYGLLNIDAKVAPYIQEMPEAYAWADFAIARAGAMTISELAAVGLPSLLVPYPHATDDHQTKNAQYLGQREAAFVWSQSVFTPEKLANQLSILVQNPDTIARMSIQARQLAVLDATNRAAEECLAFLPIS